jgi:hypothetical protein
MSSSEYDDFIDCSTDVVYSTNDCAVTYFSDDKKKKEREERTKKWEKELKDKLHNYPGDGW